MRKFVSIIFLIQFLFISIYAQDQTITGKVRTEKEGTLLSGVTVTAKNEKVSTVTDINGTYKINVQDKNTTLVFRYLGYESKTVGIDGRSVIDVSLRENFQELDELMIVGYGTIQKENFAGSASLINSEVFENRPLTSFEKALQGPAAGVQVSSASGQPGASSTVRIRGVGSFSASNTPLYVIDGLVITNGNMSYMAQSDVTYTGDVLSSLNPNDIESVTVLKDAAAAAIYGSRAANGVILINTKKGKAGKTQFSVTSSGGYSTEAVKKHETLTGSQYYKLYWDTYYNQKRNENASETDAVSFANKETNKRLFGVETKNNYNTPNPYSAAGILAEGASLLYDTNWRDEVLRRGMTKSIDISANGGSDKIRFFVSGGYFDQDGIVIGSDFKRYSGRVNISNKVNNQLEIGVNNHLSYSIQNTPLGSTSAANPVRFGDLVSNIYPLFILDNKGQPVLDNTNRPQYNYTNPLTNDYNPVALAELDEFNTRTARVITSPFAELKFLKYFKARSSIGIDYIANRERQFYNMLHGNGVSAAGRGFRYSREDITTTFINTINFNRSFGQHNFDVLLGQEAYKTRRDNTYSQATNFPFPGVEELIAASNPSVVRSFLTAQTFESYFSRLNYNLAGKYYVTGSFRRDGSSIFSPKFKFGNFYSVGAAWRIGKESFLSNLSFLDELKIKASYGVLGNDRIGVDNNRNLEKRYAWQGLYSLGRNYEGQSGITYSQLENPNLQWEKSKSTNIGLDFSGMNNRISGELSYYNRGSDGLLFPKFLSRLTGFESIISNLAAMDNYGMEILLNVNPVRNQNTHWNMSFNFTSNRNKIRKMTQDEVVEQGTFKRWLVGQDRHQWYLREYAGVDPNNGRPLWYYDELDIDGKPTGNRLKTSNWSTATQYGNLGSSLPKFTGGFNNSVKYKEFDLNLFTYFSAGNKIYDNLYSQLMHAGATSGQQLSVDILNAWQKPGDITDIPRFGINNTDLANNTSSRFLANGSYIRVKNISFGYTLNKQLLQPLGLSSARIYFMAENPFTIAHYKGMDPEVDNSGLNSNDIPNIKTVSFGVNLRL